MSAVDAPRAAGADGDPRPHAQPDGAPSAWAPAGPAARRPRRDWRWPLALALLLAGSLALRLWGIRQGLPYAYNSDENSHFVPKAIGMFGHDYNPRYFVNPPAYTYVLHFVFGVWFGGRAGVSRVFATDPATVFVVARATAAVLGTIAVGLLYGAGARIFDRRVGLLAAGLLGVGFLPVFYSHLALNDVPTLAPVCLSLLGTAGVMRRGRPIDFVIAGLGLGLACAAKYTGGVVLLPLLAAAATHGRRGIVWLVVACGLALGAFIVANPYALFDYASFRSGLTHQSTVASDAATGKLGITQKSGIAYYLWTLTWGLGWVPAFAALAGAALLAWKRSWLFWALVPAPILFIAFMGTQGRFFGRWLLPVFPIVCLLAAYAAFRAVDALGKDRPALRPTLVALVVVALCVQGVLFSVHAGLVLSREDTRNITRAWAVANIPPTSRIVVEPGVVPDGWAQDIGNPSPLTANGNRWIKYGTSRSMVNNDGTLITKGPGRIVSIEDYERTTRPELVNEYENGGYCWIISGSTQSGRAFAEPGKVPQAIAYYRELARRADVVFRSSPYRDPRKTVNFNFDWSFDYYPLGYHRPGPLVTVYKLRGGQCAQVP